MTLAEWISKEGLTQRQAANRLGIDEAALSRYVNAKSLPSLPIAARIKKLTDDQVGFESWLPAEPSSAPQPVQAAASR